MCVYVCADFLLRINEIIFFLYISKETVSHTELSWSQGILVNSIPFDTETNIDMQFEPVVIPNQCSSPQSPQNSRLSPEPKRSKVTDVSYVLG